MTTSAPPSLPDSFTVEPKPHAPGRTSVQSEKESKPRLPHEHDESSDSQRQQPGRQERQAHADVARGLVDTDRGPPMDETYRRSVKR